MHEKFQDGLDRFGGEGLVFPPFEAESFVKTFFKKYHG